MRNTQTTLPKTYLKKKIFFTVSGIRKLLPHMKPYIQNIFCGLHTKTVITHGKVYINSVYIFRIVYVNVKLVSSYHKEKFIKSI